MSTEKLQQTSPVNHSVTVCIQKETKCKLQMQTVSVMLCLNICFPLTTCNYHTSLLAIPIAHSSWPHHSQLSGSVTQTPTLCYRGTARNLQWEGVWGLETGNPLSPSVGSRLQTNWESGDEATKSQKQTTKLKNSFKIYNNEKIFTYFDTAFKWTEKIQRIINKKIGLLN